MPAVVASRPQRTEQMFQALKRHIIREREKKKQEQEADAEVERQRKEREAQQKQNVMTLGENREQIAQLELVLAQLKDEKHQLFLKLKKVLNEDDNRRRQLVRQESSFPKINIPEKSEVMDLYSGLYPGVPPAMGGHIPHLVMQQNYSVADRTLYKVPPSHTLLPPTQTGVWSPLHPSERGPSQIITSQHPKGSLKRTRSPSPPPQPSYPQNYGQKPPSRVTYQKSSGYGTYYPAPGTTGANSGGGYTYSSPQFVPASSRAEPPQQPDNIPPSPQAKHPVYMAQPLPRPSMNQAYMHTSIEHNKPSYPEEKFYSVPAIRPTTHVPLHGGAIPIQQPAQGAKTGGITTGYPIRPSSSAPPPPSHVATSHYVSQAPSGSRLVYSQAGLTSTRYVPREV